MLNLKEEIEKLSIQYNKVVDKIFINIDNFIDIYIDSFEEIIKSINYGSDYIDDESINKDEFLKYLIYKLNDLINKNKDYFYGNTKLLLPSIYCYKSDKVYDGLSKSFIQGKCLYFDFESETDDYDLIVHYFFMYDILKKELTVRYHGNLIFNENPKNIYFENIIQYEE